MDIKFILAQVVMFLAFVIMTSSFWCKKRENILKLQIFSSLFFVIQYVLLGAYTGALLNLISIGRAIFFGKKPGVDEVEKKKIISFKRDWLLYLFVVVFTVASVLTWDGPKSCLAFIATLVYTFGLWADKPQFIRGSANIASFFWFSYNFVVRSYVGCVTETILFISNTIALIKLSKPNKKYCC